MRRIEAEAIIGWLTFGLIVIGAYEAALFCLFSIPLLMLFGGDDTEA
jgi:hypothetical protein